MDAPASPHGRPGNKSIEDPATVVFTGGDATGISVLGRATVEPLATGSVAQMYAAFNAYGKLVGASFWELPSKERVPAGEKSNMLGEYLQTLPEEDRSHVGSFEFGKQVWASWMKQPEPKYGFSVPTFIVQAGPSFFRYRRSLTTAR
ncbi:hypothetical protein K488DRAFT_88451 [Vararia minispora EC-137]|uniref:Uncharacterized protein n=1 Tax=Vararia minispora EC-137 TaxID=1314806 RepID=A0ACB8QDU9_9AGAM|nr:hypothetical protein K488DRAFT_88451 [Vararia minispora EC-137]